MPGRLATAVLAAACALCAQQDPASPQPLDPSKWVPIDQVVATVNDAVILHSEVFGDAIERIAAEERRLEQQLAPADRLAIYQAVLRERIDVHALAQSAKTLGVLPPEQVEQIFQQQLLADEQDQVRNLGSVQRYSQEIARMGWQAYVRQQRVQVMSRLARQMSMNRLQNQENLFITPRMMRDFYRVNRALFVHDDQARVGTLVFTGPTAAVTAQEASEEWRASDLTVQQLADRYSSRGARLPNTHVLDRSRQNSLVPELLEFGLAGPAGNTSPPIQVGEAYWVCKVLSYSPARASGFDDPEVQTEIRRQMENSVYEVLLEQTRQRAYARTHVWMPKRR